MTTPTIYQALSAAMRDVGAVRKDQVNSHQRFNFRGVDAVVNAVSPAFREHGIIVAPMLQSKELKETRTAKGAVMANVYVTVTYRFHGPAGDFIDATVAAESFDSGDKATAKAMSVAFRTALLQTLALPTDEVDDPDHQTYERAPVQHQQAPPPPPAPPVVPASQSQRDLADDYVMKLGLTDEQLAASVEFASKGRTRVLDELQYEWEFERLNGFLGGKLQERQAEGATA